MRTYVVMAAGGSGSRMGGEQPKQFMEVNGQSILRHSIRAFVQAYPDISVILVLPELYIADFNGWGAELETEHITVVRGGATRFESVRNGLRAITGPGIVFVHDAARCLVTPDLIRRCYSAAVETGSAIPVVPAKNSLRLLDVTGHRPLNREQVRVVQTPQTFQTAILLPAFEQPYQEIFTDEATVAEAAGQTVHLVEGEETNIKITVPVDLIVAEALLKNRFFNY